MAMHLGPGFGDTSDDPSNFSDPSPITQPRKNSRETDRQAIGRPSIQRSQTLYSFKQPPFLSPGKTPESRDSDTSDPIKTEQQRKLFMDRTKKFKRRHSAGPIVQDVTEEYDMGYEGDVEGQLPNDYRDASEVNSRGSTADTSSGESSEPEVLYEDVLVKGINDLHTTDRLRTYRKYAKPRNPNRLKRRHSPSTSSDEDFTLRVSVPKGEERLNTLPRKRGRRLNHSLSSSTPTAGGANEMFENVMEIDNKSSSAP